jgi:uncharacterized protein YjeT (DUF2065 family)
MIQMAKYVVILFGLFLIGAGLLMLFRPQKAREYLRKVGSNNLINYSEITIRMIPAAALIMYSDLSKYPDIFRILGWFMIATSLILYFTPRQMHHRYALKCADILSPLHFRLISPFSILFGCSIIYSVL